MYKCDICKKGIADGEPIYIALRTKCDNTRFVNPKDRVDDPRNMMFDVRWDGTLVHESCMDKACERKEE